MLRDYTTTALRLHQARLRDWTDEATRDAVLRQAREVRPVRRAIGNTLIALGERIADRPQGPMMDKAA